MDTVFSQANISPTLGAELMATLGIDALAIQNPALLSRFLDVAEYLGKYEDGLHIARIVTSKSMPKDRLDKLWDYVRLRKEMSVLQSELDALSPEMVEERERLEAEQQKQLATIGLYE